MLSCLHVYLPCESVIRQFDRLKDTHKVEPQYLETDLDTG